MRRCTSRLRAAVCVLCVLGVCCLLLVSRSTGWRTWLEEHIVYRALRTVGPALREECLPTSTNGPRLENVSIAVVTLNGAKDELYQVSHGNKQRYCKQHGYELLDGTGRYGSKGVGLSYYSWLKVQFVCTMMEQNKHHQWLFWMDTDALFMNMHIKLSQLLVGATEDDIIIVAADAEGLNAGTFLIRNDQQGRKFCQDWIGRRYTFRYEQQALSVMYNHAVRESGNECIVREQENLRHPSGVKACLDRTAPGFRVLKLCAMGSWGGLEWKRGHGFYFQGFYMYGDFIVHFAGNHPKLPLMKLAQQKLD